MKLYLLRHGTANQNLVDHSRELTNEGKEEMRLSALALLQMEAKPITILHSPLLRSIQSAEILAQYFCESPLVEKPNLCPDSDPSLFLPYLQDHTQDIAVVGHEPHLTALSTLLTTGQSQPKTIRLKKSGIIALKHNTKTGHWEQIWHLSPKVIRLLSLKMIQDLQ